MLYINKNEFLFWTSNSIKLSGIFQKGIEIVKVFITLLNDDKKVEEDCEYGNEDNGEEDEGWNKSQSVKADSINYCLIVNVKLNSLSFLYDTTL